MGQCLKEDTKIQGKERSVKVECKKKRTKFEGATPAIKMDRRGGHVCKLVENTRIQTLRFGQSTYVRIDKYKQK